MEADQHAAIAELMGPDLMGTVMATFNAIEICEEEIAEARGTSTVDRDDPLWNAFALLRPTHDRMTQVDYVYRAHCRELLDRVRRSDDTRPATDIEILLAISDASMVVPLERGLTALMMRLFERRLPKHFETIGVNPLMYVDETLDANRWEEKLRREAAEDWRR